jgi:Gluconate 2-dehydrogenase subunit 3
LHDTAVDWTNTNRSTLRAAIDRIIPADDFPSGWDAGAGDYIERILARDLADRAKQFADGLSAIDAAAQSRFGSPFTSLQSADQDEVLKAIESNAGTAGFFRLLVELCSEGFYSDPSGGGNRGLVSWKMIGYDPKGQLP